MNMETYWLIAPLILAAGGIVLAFGGAWLIDWADRRETHHAAE
jgi:hypothetical protein